MSEQAPKRSASRRLRIGLGLALAIVLIGGVVTAIVRPGKNSVTSQPGKPPQGQSLSAAATISEDYYLDVQRDDPRDAYSLLCAQQQGGFSEYATEVSDDIKTGTGVASFELTTSGKVSGLAAAVPANIALSNGEKTPIIVLLKFSGNQWQVCSSNLGGVLPGPASGSSAPTAPPAKSV